ncbi:TonB-dependent receptor plug domain-containing protein [Marilutibacter alkalisoli]|uniref:TonB-dependent receptor n=1 Tax=Marilutibacter alkalisoli TaxID=2591633 RepID=A0A514BP13_9GAMM|nr:TonB-dependent receptor [Lysobacter alkalisoli]QDH69123.1 TonB-dependent receptor [Lysobacter alkalisoli]
MNHLRSAMRVGLLPACIALALTPVVAGAQESGSEATTLDRIQVTGSRIKRADIEGSLPITVITRAEIDSSGDISVADYLRGTSFNSFGSFRPRSGSSAQSFAGISLRGLGEERTLVLVDGRRAAISPSAGQGQDLNIIPMAAVERIEMLLDGASSVYGSDAIGGVINIITRKDYDGAEITLGRSFPTRPGGDTDEGNALFGISSDRGHLLASASYENRDIVWSRDRPWTEFGTSIYSNNFWRAPSTAGSNLLGSVPGGCADPGYFVDDGGVCRYIHTITSAEEAAVSNRSLVAKGSYNINNDWQFYGSAIVSRVKSFGRYAPVPSSPWPAPGMIAISPDSPNHPGNVNGNNPDAANWTGPSDTVYLTHRFSAGGPRDGAINSNLYDLNLGFEGRVGNVDLDFGIRRNEYKTDDVGRNYVVAAIAGAMIESGEYNIYNPSGNSRDVLNQFTTTIYRESTTKLEEIYASAGFDLFQMSGGTAAAVVGAEYRKESYSDIYDSLSEAGQVVGSSGNSAGGSRDVYSAYGEILFPILDNLEANLSARYDRYSDYGSDFSPKVSLRYQPLDSLTLRASYGQGFRAPTLDIVTQRPSFSAAGTNHPRSLDVLGGPGDTSTQVTTYQIANPNLESETSKQWALGAAWDATDWLNMSLDYYNIKIEDQIGFIGVNGIWQCLEGVSSNCPPGLSVFPTGSGKPNPALGLGIEYGPDGEIAWAQTGSTNFGTVETEGMDFNLRTRFDFDAWGSLRQNLQVSNPFSYKVNGGDSIVGRSAETSTPRYRAVLQNAWSLGDWEFAWNLNYIHGMQSSAYRSWLGLVRKENRSAQDNEDMADYAAMPSRMPSWVTHDLQVSYNAPWNAKVTFGVQNVADKDPVIDPLEPAAPRSYAMDLYNGYGRMPYVRYTQKF